MQHFTKLRRRSLVAFSLILGMSGFALPAYGENRAIVYGGNDDPSDLFNQFLPNMTSLGRALKAHRWDVQPLYGSDERTRCTLPFQNSLCRTAEPAIGCCPEGINPNFWNASTLTQALSLKTNGVDYASRENFLKLLIKARRELPVPSQLLIAIDTHGTPGRFRGATGEIHYDDPEVLEQLKAIAKKGIHLGFLLGSCFSGSALPILNQYGCVVTSSSATEVAYYQWRRDWKTSRLSSGENHTEEKYTFDSAWNGHARLLELALTRSFHGNSTATHGIGTGRASSGVPSLRQPAAGMSQPGPPAGAPASADSVRLATNSREISGLKNRAVTLSDLFVGDLVRNARSCFDDWKTSNPQISGFSFDPKIAKATTSGILPYLKFIREAAADPITKGKGLQSITEFENTDSIALKNQRPECQEHYLRALTFIQQKDSLIKIQSSDSTLLKACDSFRLTGDPQ